MEADWSHFKRDLDEYDWHISQNGSAEKSLDTFLEILWLHLVKHIPRRQSDIMKRSRPWVNDRNKNAIREKNNAEGSISFAAASANSAKVLSEERAKHVQHVKDKMAKLPAGSKQWWKINRELLHRKATLSSIPSLRESDKWLTDAKNKADAFARVFESKAHLPEELVDTPFCGCAMSESIGFFSFRGRVILKLLKKLMSAKP